MQNLNTTREKILNAAFQLFSSKGYQATTTREIAINAEVAEITLFRNFSTKENLFSEVLRAFSSIPTLSHIIPNLLELPYKDSLEKLTTGFITRLEHNRQWIQLLSSEMLYAPEAIQHEYHTFLQNIFQLFTSFFVDAQARGLARTDIPAEHLARTFHTMFYGFFHVECLLGSEQPLSKGDDSVFRSLLTHFYTGSAKN